MQEVLSQVLTWMLLGTAAAAGLMLVLWLIHFAIRNASIVDPGWAASLALIAVIYALKGEGYAQTASALQFVIKLNAFSVAPAFYTETSNWHITLGDSDQDR